LRDVYVYFVTIRITQEFTRLTELPLDYLISFDKNEYPKIDCNFKVKPCAGDCGHVYQDPGRGD